MLDPILQKVLTEEIEGENEVDYMKINTDEQNDLAAKYKVSTACSSVPLSVFLFHSTSIVFPLRHELLSRILPRPAQAQAQVASTSPRHHDEHTSTFILLEISATCTA